MEIILMFFLDLIIIVLLIFYFRNNATFEVRVKILNTNFELYKYLPPYNDMYYSFKSLKFDYWVEYCENKRREKGDEN